MTRKEFLTLSASLLMPFGDTTTKRLSSVEVDSKNNGIGFENVIMLHHKEARGALANRGDDLFIYSKPVGVSFAMRNDIV